MPAEPTPVGSPGREVTGDVHSVFVQDGFADVGVGDALVILDVTDPARPGRQ